VPRKQRNQKALPAIWRVPDGLWSVIERVLTELDPPTRTGRKRIDARGALDAIIFRLYGIRGTRSNVRKNTGSLCLPGKPPHSRAMQSAS